MVTRNDVAKRANVSTAVVSYVLNNTNYVSREKREAVLRAMEELNYIPNRTARSLRKNKTYQMAVLRGNTHNDMFNDLLFNMEGLACERGYIVSLITVIRGEDMMARDFFVDDLISRRFDAIFVANSSLSEAQVNKLVSYGIAVLLYTTRDYFGLDKRIRCLAPDYRKGLKRIIDRLIDYGHTKIAFVPNMLYPNMLDRGNHRFDGYASALEARSIPLNPDYVCNISPNSIEEVLRSVDRLFDPREVKEPPTALYADESVVACSVIRHLQSKGIRVPEDVSVVSSSDSPLARMFTPRLTTLGIDSHALAAKAVNMMLDLMDEVFPEDTLMEMTLFERESAGRAGGAQPSR